MASSSLFFGIRNSTATAPGQDRDFRLRRLVYTSSASMHGPGMPAGWRRQHPAGECQQLLQQAPRASSKYAARASSAPAAADATNITVNNIEAVEKKGLTNEEIHASGRAMNHPLIEATLQVVKDVVREMYLSYRFVRSDLFATVVPCILLTLATHLKGPTFFGLAAPISAPLWKSLPCAFVWVWFYACVVAITNQAESGRGGANEDVVNKPKRPIPSGQVTVEGAYYRLVWVYVMFMLLGLGLGVGFPTALWVISVIVLNNWRPSLTSLHWLVKPIVMMVGIWAMCIAHPVFVNRAALSHSPTLIYMAATSIALGAFGSHLQDLRDIEGDKLVAGGRITLPILLGDMPARYVCSFLLLCTWATMHIALMVIARPYNFATSMAILAWCIMLCLRILFLRTSSQDANTYSGLLVLFCFTFFGYSWAV